MTLVVPPSSLVIVRSELVHGGTGAKDDVWQAQKALAGMSYPRSIRLHMNLQDEDDVLYDAAFVLLRAGVFLTPADMAARRRLRERGRCADGG